MAKQKPILSITMLASDRMDTLQRCLEALMPIRQAIPSELIVVDTSKNPAVHELIKKYADKVGVFEWCNDFSKARNACLELAEGEWFMYVDDDEWFAEPEELIRFFQSGEYKEYGAACHRQKHFLDPEYKTFTYGWETRLSKMWPDTAFHSRIHEYIAPRKGRTKKLLATNYHSGYIFASEESKKAKFARNIVLLEEMEKEEPDVLRWKVQIMQEYAAIQDWEHMIAYGNKTLDYLWSHSGKVERYFFAVLHIMQSLALNALGRYEEVKLLYQKAWDVVKDTIAAKAYMESCMAVSYWKLGEYEQALEHAENYLSIYELYLRDPDCAEMESTIVILSDAFSDGEIDKVYTIVMGAQLKRKDRQNSYSGKKEKLSDWYLLLDMNEWRSFLNARLEELEMEQVEMLQDELKDSALENDVHYFYFMMIYAEQRLLIAENENLSFDDMTDLLGVFSDYTCRFFETLYLEQVQAVDVEQWPKKYQAAKWLQVYFAEVGENLASAMGCLAKVIAAYPRLADSMKYYLERIQIEILECK